MKIVYNPSNDIWNLNEIGRFHKDYLDPLGRPRKSLVMAHNVVLVRADAAGFLSLAETLLNLALGRLSAHTLEEVQKWGPGESWYGDLEPSSPIFTLKREGLAENLELGFEYEPPPFRPDLVPPMDPQSDLTVLITSYEGGLHHIVLTANAQALMSLAKHSIYLAQPDVVPGSQISYDKSRGMKSNAPRLVTERFQFPKDAPLSQ